MRQSIQRLFWVASGLWGLCLMAGCQTDSTAKAGEGSPLQTMTAQLPFDRVWVKPGVPREKYTKLIVTPVNTQYLLDHAGWKAANPTNRELEHSAQDLAMFTRETFINTISHDPRHRFAIVGWDGPDVLILELALVELMPDPSFLKAIDLTAPTPPPGTAGTGKAASQRPRVAIEGRVRDSVTGEVLMLFADREVASLKMFDVKELTWWSCAKESIRKWANDFVTVANTPILTTAEGSPEIRLEAW